MREVIAGRFVGSSVRRVEDRRLLSGKGRYVDDLIFPEMLHAAFVRSPHPHATIRSVDVTAARALPGVVGVLTGTDMIEISNPYVGMTTLAGLYEPAFYSLATDRVRYVGDPIAVVIARSRRLAEDGVEAVVVEYELLDAIATVGQALDGSRPAIWPKAKGNVVYRTSRNYGPVDEAFADADRVVSQRFRQHRQSNQPMETRGIVVEVSAGGATTVHSTTQSAHLLKWVLSLLSDRQSIPTSLKMLASNRERPKRFASAAKAFMANKPDLVAANKASTPVMLKQLRADPKRGVAMQRSLLALLAKEPGTRPEVRTGDIGGAFGTKSVVSREEVAVYIAARKLGRTVKWIEDRNEHLLGGGHARDEYMDMQFAFSHNGILLGIRADFTLDAGAYPAMPFSPAMMAEIIRTLLPGPYRVPALGYNATVVASNKGTVVPYRGPWAIETWARERMWDTAARELGINRAEIRRRNMFRADELPRPMITGPMLDVRMSARRTLDEALRIAGYDNWAEEQQAARANGRILGLGFATFIEPAPGPPDFFSHVLPGFASIMTESTYVALDPDGSVSVFTPQIPHGQGHETTLAQVAADQLGVPMETIRVRYGDTKVTPFSILGTGGSRSAPMAGGSVTFASRDLRDRILDISADLLEAAREDLTIDAGRIHVQGVPSISIGFETVAVEALRRGSDAPNGEAIRAIKEYDGGAGGWSQATHVCWVEIDLETGMVAIPRYVVVEDCGELINPAIVDGQVRGGVAQGIGAVLYERIAYDDAAQFQSGTFMDYLIPTAMEIPDIEIHHLETPSNIEANYRGVGEGGMIAAPAALTNAIEDALNHLGVRITEQHLPPARILTLAGVLPTG